MNTINDLNAAVRYIEENLQDEIDIDKAALIAGASTDGFCRFFSYMTGMTLNEYIRRRRMSLAGNLLKDNDARIIDIAMQLGYDSADAFSRAFTRQHGKSPSEYRKNGGSLIVFPPVSFHIKIKGAQQMNFRIIDLPEMELMGISRAYDGLSYNNREELRSQMWSQDCDDIPGQLCSGHWNQQGNKNYDGTWYGVWENGAYMIARAPNDIQNGEFENKSIPAGTYAVFSTEKGGFAWEEFPKLFELVFESWLPSSGYRLAGDRVIEVYHLYTDHDRRKKERFYELMIPISMQ